MAAIAGHWPLFDLRIITPRLILRVPTDDDLAALADLVRAGIHDPATMPFTVPWTDRPSPEREQRFLQYHWQCRAGFGPDAWRLELAVFVDDCPVGMQALAAADFPVLRTAETGSWLGLAHHGQGIGTEMRAAIVHFGFEWLGALAITSTAFADNAASRRVSTAIGYEPNGLSYSLRREERAESVHFLLTRERWLAHRRDLPIEVTGLDRCRPLLGL